MTNYRADVYYLDASETGPAERRTELRFTATSHRQAVERLALWFASRQQFLPEIFGEMLALKLYLTHLSPLGERGDYLGEGLVQVFEWKCDWGSTLQQQVEAKL